MSMRRSKNTHTASSTYRLPTCMLSTVCALTHSASMWHYTSRCRHNGGCLSEHGEIRLFTTVLPLWDSGEVTHAAGVV